MIFKEWLLLNENILENFDDWLKAIIKYAKPSEKEILHNLGLYGDNDMRMANSGDIVYEFNNRLSRYKYIIIRILGKEHLENLNWLSFSIGYLASKTFHEEDLELAIDVTKRRIDSRELPKSEIGQKGWMVIGKEAQQYVEEYLRAQQELSNRQKLKLKKSGDTLEEDKDLIKLIASEGDLKLYYLPKLIDHSKAANLIYDQITTNKSQIEARKRLLCKYGKSTDWCTANPNGEYDRYYAGNDIYIVQQNDTPKYQFTSCLTGNTQFMDVKDRHVTDIELEVKELFEKHTPKETNCYDFRIIFSDLESYKKNKHRKVSTINIKDLMPQLNPEEITGFLKNMLGDIDVEDLKSSDVHTLIKNLPDGGADHFDDKAIRGLILKLQWHGYDELSNKLSSNRLQKFLSNYKNSEDYIQGTQGSRKKTIRDLLSNTSNSDNSLRILKFLTEKINFGSEEAYTAFDAIISILISYYAEDMLDKEEVDNSLNDFAKDLGKSNINKIDLNRLQQRMNIELTPQDGKLKITMPGENYRSARYLMALFLKKHSDKII
jgi:hypothetical protein